MIMQTNFILITHQNQIFKGIFLGWQKKNQNLFIYWTTVLKTSNEISMN